jgi:hypothetical protein
MLVHLLAVARARGYTRVSLETGRTEAFAPAVALSEIMRSLTDSIMNSSGSSTPTLVVPSAPTGTTAVTLEPM